MKYTVLKELPGVKVGDILKRETYEGMPCLTQEVPVTCLLIGEHNIQNALDQGFIEPYEEKPKRWRAGDENYYYQVSTQDYNEEITIQIEKSTDYHIGGTAENFLNTGNYFKSKETAEAVAEALKLLFEFLHTPDLSNGMEPEVADRLDDAISTARSLVLSCNEASDE